MDPIIYFYIYLLIGIIIVGLTYNTPSIKKFFGEVQMQLSPFMTENQIRLILFMTTVLTVFTWPFYLISYLTYEAPKDKD